MSRTCREVEIELGAYAAGELVPLAAARVRGHLADCAACRAELAAERELRRTFASLERPRCPDAVTARIRRRTVDRPTTGRRIATVRRWGGSLAAAAVLAVLLWPGLREGAPRSVEPAAWSRDELLDARREAALALAWTAEILERTERHTVQEVFGRTFAGSVQGSLLPNADTPQGGEG